MKLQPARFWLCLSGPVKELGDYLSETVEVGTHVGTQAREMFLVLAPACYFGLPSLCVGEVVPDELHKLMSKTSPAQSDSWVFCFT